MFTSKKKRCLFTPSPWSISTIRHQCQGLVGISKGLAGSSEGLNRIVKGLHNVIKGIPYITYDLLMLQKVLNAIQKGVGRIGVQ